MSDLLNVNIPVANPDANGLYDWVVVRAGGGESGFSSVKVYGSLSAPEVDDLAYAECQAGSAFVVEGSQANNAILKSDIVDIRNQAGLTHGCEFRSVGEDLLIATNSPTPINVKVSYDLTLRNAGAVFPVPKSKFELFLADHSNPGVFRSRSSYFSNYNSDASGDYFQVSGEFYVSNLVSTDPITFAMQKVNTTNNEFEVQSLKAFAQQVVV